jgi:prolyl 4-hydroxylase
VNKYVKPPGEAGQGFRPHYDYFVDESNLKHYRFDGCQRAATLLIYLSDNTSGGETLFMRDGRSADYNPYNPSHVKVTPKRGRILAWFNCHPLTEAVDGATLHAGVPIEEGVKLAATLFIRNCTASMPEPEDAADFTALYTEFGFV